MSHGSFYWKLVFTNQDMGAGHVNMFLKHTEQNYTEHSVFLDFLNYQTNTRRLAKFKVILNSSVYILLVVLGIIVTTYVFCDE